MTSAARPNIGFCLFPAIFLQYFADFFPLLLYQLFNPELYIFHQSFVVLNTEKGSQITEKIIQKKEDSYDLNRLPRVGLLFVGRNSCKLRMCFIKFKRSRTRRKLRKFVRSICHFAENDQQFKSSQKKSQNYFKLKQLICNPTHLRLKRPFETFIQFMFIHEMHCRLLNSKRQSTFCKLVYLLAIIHIIHANKR